MRISYEMTYMGAAETHSAISPVPYTAEYKEKYKKLYNDCYHDMREAPGSEPYDFIQDDSFLRRERRRSGCFSIMERSSEASR